MVFCPKCGKRFLDAFENPEALDLEKACAETTEPIQVLATHQASGDVTETIEERVGNNTQQPPKRKSKKAVWLVLALLVIVGGIIGFFGMSGSDDTVSITDAANSVLYLEVCDDTDYVIATASGFIIEDGTTLVTNYHVIDGAHHIIAYCIFLLNFFSVGLSSQSSFALLVELSDCGELLQEPLLDFLVGSGISEGFLCLCAGAAQHLELSHDGLIIVIVGSDILCHVAVSQTLVVGLLLGGGSLDLDLKVGIHGAEGVQLVELLGINLASGLGLGLGHLDLAGKQVSVHSCNLLLINYFLFCWGFVFPSR